MKLTREQIERFAAVLEHSAANIHRYLRENEKVDLTDRDIRLELRDIAIQLDCH